MAYIDMGIGIDNSTQELCTQTRSSDGRGYSGALTIKTDRDRVLIEHRIPRNLDTDIYDTITFVDPVSALSFARKLMAAAEETLVYQRRQVRRALGLDG